jgi:very-short-patch-repair endonuclease
MDNKYILDFYCSSAKLCVEIDGSSHNSKEAQSKDKYRDAYLAKYYGITTLRFSNEQALNDPRRILRMIDKHCDVQQPSIWDMLMSALGIKRSHKRRKLEGF